MILINLLPHREAARQRHKENFQTIMLASFMVGLLLSSIVYFWLQNKIEGQLARNAFLSSEIAQLNQQIKEIEGLEGEITALRERQTAVEDLQANRNLPVHLLNEVVRQIPEGVYISAVKQNDNLVDVKGVAQSSQLVSKVLHNFSNESPWFTQPNLKEIVATSVSLSPKDERKVVSFSLTFALAHKPVSEEVAALVQPFKRGHKQ